MLRIRGRSSLAILAKREITLCIFLAKSDITLSIFMGKRKINLCILAKREITPI